MDFDNSAYNNNQANSRIKEGKVKKKNFFCGSGIEKFYFCCQSLRADVVMISHGVNAHREEEAAKYAAKRDAANKNQHCFNGKNN